MKLKTKDFFYVVIQFVLFAVYILDINFLQFILPEFLNMFSIIIAIIGGFIILIAMLQLNKNLSPFPSPKSNSQLIKKGLYKYIRHPIYTGILLLSFGFGIYLHSTFKIIVALSLLILFYFKTSYEEQRLLQKFADYFEYKKMAGRFLPKL